MCNSNSYVCLNPCFLWRHYAFWKNVNGDSNFTKVKMCHAKGSTLVSISSLMRISQNHKSWPNPKHIWGAPDTDSRLMGRMRMRVHSSRRTAIALGHGLLQSPLFGGVMHSIYARDKLGVKGPIKSHNAFCSRHGLQYQWANAKLQRSMWEKLSSALKNAHNPVHSHRDINTWERSRCLCECMHITG